MVGEPEFGTGFDANGSSESFELVTEENNGDGSKKQGTEGRCGINTPAHYKHKYKKNNCLKGLFLIAKGLPVRMSGFLWSCALECRCSARS